MGEYGVVRTEVAPKIDGKRDDAWRSANWSGAFHSTAGGPKMPFASKVQLMWDSDYLYLWAEMQDSDVRSPVFDKDGALWKHDVIEMFIDDDRNATGYVELQVNPNNTQLDYKFASTRARPPIKSWDAKMKSAVVVDGSLNSGSNNDQGWTVEARIPFSTIAPAPNAGSIWNFNVVRIDKPQNEGMRVHSLYPISIRDFHAPEKMGSLVFVGK